MCVIGTRPEAIKMAPIIRELSRFPRLFTTRVCVTAQHRDLLDGMLAEFRIVPDIDLNVMQPNQSIIDVTCAVLNGMQSVLRQEQPDWVIVQGDTTSVSATAQAARYLQLRVGHVEAGLRSHDRSAPFPEEDNRRVVSSFAELHFAPTDQAAANLRAEGIPRHAIHVTGNTGIDTLFDVLRRPESERIARAELGTRIPSSDRLVLVTAHRRENHRNGIVAICAALREIAARHADVRIVFPVHPNPAVRMPVERGLSGVRNISLVPPVSYASMVWLLSRCALVLTDSGGLQEEAPYLGKPVLVLRERTERPEGLTTGLVHLVGTDPERIVAAADALLAQPPESFAPAQPYGDGQAARRVVRALTTA